MQRIPAFCPNCRLLFPTGLVVAEGATVGLFGTITNCPRCGGDADFPDGIYEAVGKLLKLTQDPKFKAEMLATLSGIFERPVGSDDELEASARDAEALHPGLGNLVRLAHKKRIWTVFAFLVFALSNCDPPITFDATLDINQLIEQIQDFSSEGLDLTQKDKGTHNTSPPGESSQEEEPEI
jgi:hypothetical protein